MQLENSVANLIKSLKNEFYLRSYYNLRFIKRCANPFLTHIPILLGISRLIKITKILECGPGYYSTSLFLDKRFFPDLVRLYSLEDNKVWFEEVRKSIPQDTRLELTYIQGRVADAIEGEALNEYDLIFVDDSKEEMNRVTTIQNIADSMPQSVIVIHDFENRLYRTAAQGFRYKYHFKAFNPDTGILWNRELQIDMERLHKIQRLIRQYSRKIPPDDTSHWYEVLG